MIKERTTTTQEAIVSQQLKANASKKSHLYVASSRTKEHKVKYNIHPNLFHDRLVTDKPVFGAQSVWSVCVQGMDLMVDHLVSQSGRMKMAL